MGALNVTWDGVLVGHLAADSGRDMSFRYAPAWLSWARARAISLSLPLREEPFTGAVAGSWFANLLPEGEARAGILAREIGHAHAGSATLERVVRVVEQRVARLRSVMDLI